MNEATSKVVVALIGVFQAAIWPSVLLVLVFSFRKQISQLAERLQTWKLSGSEFVFREVEHLQAELQKTNLVVGGLSEQSNSPKIAAAAKGLLRPPGEAVAAWAGEHRASNPWDMGPKNWERCLFDLGYPGGKRNELAFEDGKLRYQ
jgi:hypothetical protein